MDVATSENPKFQPMGSTTPWGEKCLLLTWGGIAVIGCPKRPLQGPYDYVAWAPLPKIPPEIKALLEAPVAER